MQTVLEEEDQSAAPFAINDRGQVIGRAEIDGITQAVMWENGERIVLDQAAATSNALAINARGHAIGYSLDAAGGRAVMWR